MSSSYEARPMFAARPLLHALAQNWWVFLLRGLSAVVLGVLTFVWPAVTFATLVLLFGAYALIDGVLAVIAAVTGHTVTPRWWLAIVGIAGIAAGLLTFARPDLAAAALLLVIAVWAFASGAMQIIGAIQLRKEIDNEWLLILSGLLSIIFGAILLLRPAVATLALILTIGTFAILYGLLLIAFAIRLKGHKHAEA
jgi:uncharacterized membrane protein HdeD (DUF308 family)